MLTFTPSSAERSPTNICGGDDSLAAAALAATALCRGGEARTGVDWRLAGALADMPTGLGCRML